MEHRESETLAAREEGLRAELRVDAGARLQRKIEPGHVVVLIGELRESRRLEAFANISIEIERGARLVDKSGHRARVLEADLAAFVPIGGARNDEIVGRIEGDFRVPQAGARAPARRELPVALRVERGASHGVVLVTFQLTQVGPKAIDVSPASLLLIVVIGTEGERERLAGEVRRTRPAQVEPVVEAVEIDHPAGRSRGRSLRRDRDREKLLDLPASTVGGEAQAVRSREPVLHGRAELALDDALAGIEQNHRGIDLPGVLLHLCAVEPRRVLRRLPHGIQDQRKTCIVAEC